MVTRQGNATTLSFFPGFNENSSEGGDELNNGLPDVFGHAVDDWFTGDFHQTLADDYNIAITTLRQLEEFTQEFHRYRFKNRIETEFTTSDNQTIDPNSVDVTYNTDLVYVTLEGENNPLRDDGIRNELDITTNKHRASPKPRYHNWKIGTVNGIDALHSASIWGAYDPYVSKMLEWVNPRSFDDLWELLWSAAVVSQIGSGLPYVAEYIIGTPAIWTWLEYTTLADGTELVRVWDVSDYPEHGGYLGDEKRDNVAIEWERREDFNLAFNNWSTLAQSPTAGPYQAINWEYKRDFDGILDVHIEKTPAMAYGYDPNRSPPELSYEEVNDILSAGFDVDPFKNKTTY